MSEQVTDGFEGDVCALKALGEGVAKPVRGEVWDADAFAEGVGDALEGARRDAQQGFFCHPTALRAGELRQGAACCEVEGDCALFGAFAVADEDRARAFAEGDVFCHY